MTEPNYPRGKIHPDDEGAAQIAVGIHNNTVVIRFSKPMRWIGLGADEAQKMGEKLLELAKEIRQ